MAPWVGTSLRRRVHLRGNGIVWKFRIGITWRDAPERYGPWATLYGARHDSFG
ncbi:transposase [Streptomyces sp. NBC_00445]|uniref:transposase n=1 Tax=Streptomyces sp. NBC_00445 TaxID=2975745 RepID=UPI003FCE3B8C